MNKRPALELARRAELTARVARDLARFAAADLAEGGSDEQVLRQRLEAARATLAKTRIHALVDGIVQTRDVEPGDLVQPGRTLLVIARSGSSEVLPAIARRGATGASIALLGIDPQRYQRIIPLLRDMVEGKLLVSAGNAVIGKELARYLELGIGDKLRVDAGEGREAVVDIAGIFELGVRELDARYVYLDLPGGITVIDTTVADIFEADRIARCLARLANLRAESWMETNGQLLNASAHKA